MARSEWMTGRGGPVIDAVLSVSRRPTMSFRDWYARQFSETLSEPLTESDGIAEPEIDGLLDGREIPLALRDYYRIAGRHWMNSHYDRLLPPNELRSEHSHIIFMDENQNVGHWGFKKEDASKNDPDVYLGQWEGDEFVWYNQDQTLSRFIIASWLETCTGGDEETAGD